MVSLKFNKSIITSVNNAIPTRDLLSRLQTLSEELSSIDQDAIDKSSLTSIKDDLVNKKLLRHSNIGVQAFVCCALSDILRIYAPDAPFTGNDLSSIFKATFQQFKKLNDQENPYFEQQTYLLKRLAETRSIVLITDLPDSEALINQIFEILYDLSSSKNFPTKLEPLASDILSEIISESETISTDVLKKILNKLVTGTPSSSVSSAASTLVGGASNISNPGFNFSVAICEANVDRMSRQVAKLFSEMLYESTTSSETSNNASEIDSRLKASILVDNLKKIHRITIQIWKYIPEMLVSLIGLIDDELKAEDEKIRVLATETIGRMIGSSSGGSILHKVDFVSTHRDIWLNWLKKTLDASPMVRSKWVEQVSHIVEQAHENNSNALAASASGSGEILPEILKGVLKCLLDTDERVRFTAVKTLDRISYQSFITKVCNEKILNTLFQLLREKNPEIRNQVIKLLGDLYNEFHQREQAGNNILNTDSDTTQSLILDIPNQILSLIYINDKQVTSTVDLAIFEKLLPFESNDIKRVDRLCQVYSNLNEKSKNSFLAINKRQQQISGVLEKFINLAQSTSKDSNKENEEEVFNKIDKIITWLSVSLPDGLNSSSCLERFYKLANFRFFYVLKISLSCESDYSTVKNSMKELLTKLGNPKNLKLEDDKSNISTTDMISNFKLLLYRSSMILFNKSNVTELINYSKQKDHQWNTVANEILETISEVVPEVFKFQIKELVDLIQASGDSKSLRTIYHFIKRYPDLFPQDTSSTFTESLKTFSVEGTPSEAKYAVKILALSPSRKEVYCTSVFNSVYPLKIEGNDKFATHISSISELFLQDPIVLEDKSSDITTLLIKEVLLKNRNSEINDESENTDTWYPDVLSVPVLNEKILALKTFVNRLRSTTSNDDISAIAQPVVKLLVSLIGNGGEIVPDESTPKAYQYQLRLHAGYFLLKLAKLPTFNDILTDKTIGRLIFLLQDQNESVRRNFLNKLQKYLTFDSVGERFLPLIFFMGHEPNSDLKGKAEIAVKSMYKRVLKGSIKFESALPRLIHLVSHTPEFSQLMQTSSGAEKDKLTENYVKAYTYASEYLIFYLRCIAKSENVSLLYYFASRIKQYRDATINEDLYRQSPLPQDAISMYCVSELAQLIIKELCDLRGWTMQTWPGKVKLSTELFAPMKSTHEAHAIISRVYLPDDIIGKLKVLIKYKFANTKKKTVRASKAGTTSKSVATSATSVSASGAKRRLNTTPQVKQRKKKAKVAVEPSRKSTRAKADIQYAEGNSEDEEDDDINDEADISNFSNFSD